MLLNIDKKDNDENRSFHPTLKSVYLHSWWKPQCWQKAPVFIFIFPSYYDIYRHESGRCSIIIPFVTYF